MRTQEDFAGLAFPVVTVCYAGPTDTRGARYIARLRNTRMVRSFDYALDGSENAYRAAVACWARYVSLERMEPYDESAHILIPGDLDDSRYSFTVVPAYFFAESEAVQS